MAVLHPSHRQARTAVRAAIDEGLRSAVVVAPENDGLLQQAHGQRGRAHHFMRLRDGVPKGFFSHGGEKLLG